jgi:transcriptional regulator with XRE-family HTH domain
VPNNSRGLDDAPAPEKGQLRIMSDILVQRIQELRKERGWSQAELARRCRIHPATVSHWFSGAQRIYPGQIRRLAKAFRVPQRALLGGDTEQLREGEAASG